MTGFRISLLSYCCLIPEQSPRLSLSSSLPLTVCLCGEASTASDLQASRHRHTETRREPGIILPLSSPDIRTEPFLFFFVRLHFQREPAFSHQSFLCPFPFSVSLSLSIVSLALALPLLIASHSEERKRNFLSLSLPSPRTRFVLSFAAAATFSVCVSVCVRACTSGACGDCRGTGRVGHTHTLTLRSSFSRYNSGSSSGTGMDC